MAGFIEGEDRRERFLLPDCLDDYVGEDNLVRVVDVFVDELDLLTLGFAGPAATGRPGYSPATMLKLYLYGYLNQVHCRFPSGQWRGNPGRLPSVREPVPRDRPDRRSDGGGGWQPLQGREHPRQELHAWRNPSTDGTGGRQHCAVSRDARHGRPPGGPGGGDADQPIV